MAETETIAVTAEDSPYRVLAWWDVDMHIGAYKKRKLTARPLRNLERILGHRVHAAVHRDRFRLPDGVWKFDGFNYIEVADSAFAAHFVLKQVSGLSKWFSGFGYRPVTTPSDDFDNDTICTFYWNDHDGPQTYRDIQSGRVLLALVEKEPKRTGRDFRKVFDNIRARPIVRPDQNRGSRADFLATMTIQFMCKNRQKLVQDHWPKLVEKYGLGPDVTVDFGPQPKDGEPNEITILKRLSDFFEHDAVAYALARTERCRFRLGGPGDDIFQGQRFFDDPQSDGMSSISLKRTA